MTDPVWFQSGRFVKTRVPLIACRDAGRFPGTLSNVSRNGVAGWPAAQLSCRSWFLRGGVRQHEFVCRHVAYGDGHDKQRSNQLRRTWERNVKPSAAYSDKEA